MKSLLKVINSNNLMKSRLFFFCEYKKINYKKLSSNELSEKVNEPIKCLMIHPIFKKQ